MQINVSHYNTFAEGGSAVYMLRLHLALLKLKNESRIFCLNQTPEVPEAYQQRYLNNPLQKWRARARCSLENRALYKPPRSYYSRLLSPVETPAVDAAQTDVTHLHWVARWLDLLSFTNSLPPDTPLVWTVHDMSPLAGGCFMDFGCDEFEKGCRVCPLLRFPLNRIWAKQELRRRLRALEGRPVAFIANSHSTFRLVEKAPLAKGKMQQIIPPGFEFSEMKRILRREARKALGIPEEAMVLGFGAASLTDENKGIKRFYEVAQKVAQEIPQTQALIFGDGWPEEKILTHHQGIIKDPTKLAVAYSAMDLHVITSEMETFGQVSVEAQAYGTPVFAFAVGGLPETLVDGKTGVLVPFGQCEEMAAQIVAARRAGRLESVGKAGADWVRKQFDSVMVAKKYVEVYEELLSQRKTA